MDQASAAALKIGVLALQGAVTEHLQQFNALGANAIAIKRPEQIAQMDGIILPGGESTTMGKLIEQEGFIQPIQTLAQTGKGIFGTCAGMILLASKLHNNAHAHLGLMDIKVNRNAYGRQVDSFVTHVDVMDENLTATVPAVFIRAPAVTQLLSNKLRVLAVYNGAPVLVRQHNLLACAFHPELSDDLTLAHYFMQMCTKRKIETTL